LVCTARFDDDELPLSCVRGSLTEQDGRGLIFAGVTSDFKSERGVCTGVVTWRPRAESCLIADGAYLDGAFAPLNCSWALTLDTCCFNELLRVPLWEPGVRTDILQRQKLADIVMSARN
jgi:hypothetical protein